jgi:hypothetical protein
MLFLSETEEFLTLFEEWEKQLSASYYLSIHMKEIRSYEI